jgi:uncharacterized protein with ParB-like and HNH nuclease domain
MTLAISHREKIGAIFSGNQFIIPSYQRKYSWEEGQIKELWEDIKDSLMNNMNHFFGTLIFKELPSPGLSTLQFYEIIDGQQRITTLFILLSELLEKLPDGDIKKELKRNFIGYQDGLKLTPQGFDSDFLNNLIFDFKNIKYQNIDRRSQCLMYKTKNYYNKLLSSYDCPSIEQLILFIRDKLEVLVLAVNKQSEAIRMFEIINDRGLPLSILDKTKSKLMLFSTIYLNEKLNNDINGAFEKVFDSYDDIIQLRNELNILGRFSETTLFSHHYLTSRKLFKETWNYRKGAEDIFNDIKLKCDQLSGNSNELEAFINNYINDFGLFCTSYANIVKDMKIKSSYVKPFRLLEFTATLYPLIVRLYMQNKLDALLSILEKVELRVYKFWGTNPVADMYKLCSQVNETNMSIKDIENYLIYIKDKFLNDSGFRSQLSSNIYGNSAVKYILIEYNNGLNNCKNKQITSQKHYKSLQIEHIFSRTPKFDVTSYGFNEEEYDYEKDKIGNLTLLESDNSNNTPQDKSDGYINSSACMTNILGSQIKQSGFQKSDVDAMTNTLINFCITRF